MPVTEWNSFERQNISFKKYCKTLAKLQSNDQHIVKTADQDCIGVVKMHNY